MRILQINKYYYLKSGSERYMLNLSSLLETHGHQIIPFVMKHEKNMPSEYSRYFVENMDYDRVINEGILKKIYVGFKSIYSWEARNKLLELVDNKTPDIAHVHKISNTLTPSILYALKEREIPTVQTLHDYRIVCPNYSMYNPNISKICEACRGHRYFNALSTKCQKSSYLVGLNIAVESYLYHLLETYSKTIDLFISPSSFLMKKVVEFGIDKEKIVCIPHFVRCDQYTPNYTSSNYILYFGRLEKHKGVKTLIKACENIGNARLVIVGEGTFRTELESYTKMNEIKNVSFLGYISDNELIKLIRNCMFTVVPSEWYEPFGFTILESYALGKPVLGANIGAIPDLVKNGYTGILFRGGDVDDLTQKIDYLLDNKNLLAEMGRNARKAVEEEFNADLHYKRLMEVYERVLN
ncbi:MAG: glycosyltransferase family 4 protein [Candidatus Bathyarchaeota archaeon]|nr:glycosyltransferase family 4 protein [Candidatus Bathyarchaeota archaeon]